MARPVLLLALALVVLVAGCRSEAEQPAEVARVGDAVLTNVDLARALEAMPPGMDTSTATAQYIEQWVAGQLLAREAERRGLRNTPEVQRQLAENERNVLAAALLGVLYEEETLMIPAADVEAYFERNRQRLLLREPYVRIRFVETRSRAAATDVRAQLAGIGGAATTEQGRDSVFVGVVRQFAADTTAALALARSYIPQSRLARQTGAAPGTIVAQLEPGQTSEVLATPDSAFYVVQVVERVPAGSEPRLGWIADDIRRQLAIERRKQAVAREVHRLRTEAEARGDLRVHVQDDAWAP
jgi:hypothetical protein